MNTPIHIVCTLEPDGTHIVQVYDTVELAKQRFKKEIMLAVLLEGVDIDYVCMKYMKTSFEKVWENGYFTDGCIKIWYTSELVQNEL